MDALKKAIGQVGDTMEEATWLAPYDFGSSRIIRGGGQTVSASGTSLYETNDTWKMIVVLELLVLQPCCFWREILLQDSSGALGK